MQDDTPAQDIENEAAFADNDALPQDDAINIDFSESHTPPHNDGNNADLRPYDAPSQDDGDVPGFTVTLTDAQRREILTDHRAWNKLMIMKAGILYLAKGLITREGDLRHNNLVHTIDSHTAQRIVTDVLLTVKPAPYP